MNRKHIKFLLAGVIALCMATAVQAQDKVVNMFGGPAYLDAPNLELTAALIRAGGGAEDFSTAKALTAMLGADTVTAEVDKLNEQYGEEKVQNFLKGTDGVVALALKHATEQGIALPEAPADLKGKKLAEALVKAGTVDDGTFWSGHFYDVLVSHDIHNAVMADVNADPDLGVEFDQNVHRITNQAFYDVAHALGHDQVKLADLH